MSTYHNICTYWPSFVNLNSGPTLISLHRSIFITLDVSVWYNQISSSVSLMLFFFMCDI